MRSLVAVLGAALLAIPLWAADEVIDDFEGGVAAWKSTMYYGQVEKCTAAGGKGVGDSGALQVDYEFGSEGTNHIIYFRDVDLDLSWHEGIEFGIKGSGDRVMIFLFVWDSQGRFRNYGPHGTNRDFHTGHAEWTTCRMSFDLDRSVQGGETDLGDVKRIGFMLNANGVQRGTVWFDNLVARDVSGSIELSFATFSPNGDGVRDVAEIVLHAPRDTKLTVEVAAATGERVATLANELAPERRRVDLSWDGRAEGKVLPDGEYAVKARFEGAETVSAEARLVIDTSHKWPAVEYDIEPFFPIGVWFEGAPGLSGCPADPAGARKYYDRCFADLAAHGFNAAAVPNCPEALWEPLLQSAEEHGIKIVLEVGPLVGLVSQEAPADEGAAYEKARYVYDKIGKYDSLLRYQIRDEPPPEMVPNWLLARRIMAALDPQRPVFSCFCHPPSLARVTDRVALPEAVVDIYPHRGGTPPQSLGGFLGAFETFEASAKKNPMWLVLQAFAVPNPKSWRYPSAEELRAVTYLSLAGGAKGIFYFIYQYMPEYLWGMVDIEGRPRPIYEPCSTLAKELQKLAPLILSLRPAKPPPAAEGDVRVGSFVGEGERPVLIVASTRPDAEVTARVAIEGKWGDAISGETFAAADGTLIVPLAAGAGRVLVRR